MRLILVTISYHGDKYRAPNMQLFTQKECVFPKWSVVAPGCFPLALANIRLWPLFEEQ